MRRMLLIPLLLVMAVGVACTDRQQDDLAQDRDAVRDYPDARSEQAMIQGELLRVDDQNDFVWIRTSEGREMQFSYTITTDVVGAGEEAEGLISDDVDALRNFAGRQVTIHYEPGVDETMLGDDHINKAVRIEIAAAAPSAPAPAAR